MDKEIALLFKSIKTYFTKDMLKIMVLPLIISFVFFYVAFFVFAAGAMDHFEDYQLQIQEQQTNIENGIINEDSTTTTVTGSSIVDYLLKHTFTSWIFGILFYSIGIIAMGYIAIFSSLIIIGFLTPKILALIHKKHYPELELEAGYGNLMNTLYVFVKSFFIMIILFIVLIPLYFIPLFNIIIMFVPFYYFFHKMLNFDVTSTIMSKEQYAVIYTQKKDNIRLKTFLLYTISLIPFVAFFIAIFYIIYLGFTYFDILNEKKELIVE